MWKTTRVELNAFTVPARIAFGEARLAEVSTDTKLLPPEQVLAEQAVVEHEAQVRRRVRGWIFEAIDEQAIVDGLLDLVPVPQSGLTATVTAAYAQDRSQRWTVALARRQAAELADDYDRIRVRVLELLFVNLKRTGDVA